MIRVEVYSKRDCCLCEEVKATLLKVRRDPPFELREIDIESGRPAFKYRVDEEAVRRRLAAAARNR